MKLQVENSLTLDHLATLPKRNKDHFLSSFTREQQLFFQQYLYEGQRVARSWDGSRPMSPPITNAAVDPQLGFGTPVLSARLDLASTRRKGSINAGRNQSAGRQESSKENEKPSDHIAKAKLLDTAKNHFNSKAGRQKNRRDDKKGSKDYSSRSDSDNELVERHADRRRRKKTKRDIMNPEFSGDDNEDNSLTICKARKQAKRQSKLHQEFALMHGFSSTNVGKNRLTLKPRCRDIGVFQKGKASGKTEVIQAGKRKRQESGFIFSEAVFLSKPSKNVSKIDLAKVAKISTTMDGDSLISSVSASTIKACPDMTKLRSRDGKAPSKSNLGSITRPQSQDEAQTGYNPANSIVWDIEHSELLGSDVSSGKEHGTIVLKLDHLPLTSNKVLENETSNSTPQQDPFPVTQSDVLSSPSLGPSQSASQTGLKTVDVAWLPTVPSKYFKPLLSSLAEPHLALTCYTVNQTDPKPSVVSELGELLTIEDTTSQMPEPASHFLHSTGPSYCDGQEGMPNVMPPVQPSYDLDVSVCEGYPDSEFWSPVNHPVDLGVDNIDQGQVNHVSVNFDGQINSSVVIPADHEIWSLDYIAGGELGEMDHTPFIPPFEYGSTEQHNSISHSVGPNDACSEVSERCREAVYQDSGSSLDMGSEDQMKPDWDFNSEYEEVSSMDLELYPHVQHHFWQGPSLLYGSSTPGESLSLHKLSNVEADVARQLQLDHWQPQKL